MNSHSYRSAWFLVLSFLSVSGLPSQERSGRDEEAAIKAVTEDPFTQRDPKLMAQAGVIAQGPMLWTSNLRTDDLEQVLGQHRIRWIETAHFRIGSNFPATTAPDDGEARKQWNEEFERMSKRCAKFPARTSKVDPWLRLHLYAQRAEETYAEFATLVGYEHKPGLYYGQKDKIPLLLFEKRSDLARLLDRFCGIKSESSQRCRYAKSGMTGLVIAAEADEPRDDAQIHALFRFLLVQLFQEGLGATPYWLNVGVAHRFARHVPSRLMMAVPKDTEAVDEATQNKWEMKMRARAKHPRLLVTFADLATKNDFGYQDHVQAWSRVDYLLQLDKTKFRAFVSGFGGGGGIAAQSEVLQRVYGMEPDAFDTKWREWVLKSYK
jgi:hypothetical protein